MRDKTTHVWTCVDFGSAGFGGRRRDRRDGVWQKGGMGSETRGFSFWWILVEGQEVRCGETKGRGASAEDSNSFSDLSTFVAL